MPPPIIPRRLDLRAIVERKSCFLFGPRQTGKSTLIRQQFADCPVWNLLDQKQFLRLSRNPALIREALAERGGAAIVVIDEIQRLPALLNEVHLLIEEHGIRFLLTGSSARRLRRRGVNLLGGRARSRVLHPFVRVELGGRFDLDRALEHGLLPPIVFSESPAEDLAAYAGDYLREEVAAEAIVRNIGAFSRFLQVAALAHGEMINFANLASDAQVPASTVREYYEILKDTLIAHEVPAFTDTRKRKAISTSKYYLFDVGVARQSAGTARTGAGNGRVRHGVRELRLPGDQGLVRSAPTRHAALLAVEVAARGGLPVRGRGRGGQGEGPRGRAGPAGHQGPAGRGRVRPLRRRVPGAGAAPGGRRQHPAVDGLSGPAVGRGVVGACCVTVRARR